MGLACLFVLTACTRGPIVFTVDLAEESEQIIEDKFTMLISGHYDPQWTTEPTGYPAHHFERRYPFIREVELLAATGAAS